MSTAKPGDKDNLKLLGAIPASARRILELGCGDGALGRLSPLKLHRNIAACDRLPPVSLTAPRRPEHELKPIPS